MENLYSYLFSWPAACVGLLFLAVALRSLLSRSSPQELTESSRRFLSRLRNPQISKLEAHFGRAFPAGLVNLYSDLDELLRAEFEVASTPTALPKDRWFVAYYLPADLDSLVDLSEGLEEKEYFGFAGDGCGNIYVVDLAQPDPPVLFVDHETSELLKVSERFSDFMRWPRIEGKN